MNDINKDVLPRQKHANRMVKLLWLQSSVREQRLWFGLLPALGLGG